MTGGSVSMSFHGSVFMSHDANTHSLKLCEPFTESAKGRPGIALLSRRREKRRRNILMPLLIPGYKSGSEQRSATSYQLITPIIA